MSHHPTATEELAAPLALPDGGFAMLALDQRESLRRMFPLVEGQEVGDDMLRSFKRDAIRALSSFASGVLLDRPYAVEHDRPAGIADDCGLILAVDVLDQPPGRAVVSTSLDPETTVEFIRRVGAVAIKLLVIWRPTGVEERTELVERFVELAREAGVASLLEGIAKPEVGDTWPSHEERHAGILAAAEELGRSGATIYKAEVPGYVSGDVSAVRSHAEKLTATVPMPWVVLSNGTDAADFADAVREACLGGASGFLAGRAIWADTVSEENPVQAMQERSIARLKALSEIVTEVCAR